MLLTKLQSQKDVTKTCFALNNHVVKVDSLIANFSTLMPGFACHKIGKENMTGSNTKMAFNSEHKITASVSIVKSTFV